jgi:8-oxo-dGTP diphosphatase
MITVTAAIICNKENKVLMAKRNNSSSVPLKWEFPGGKVENNETPEESLKREIFEELRVHVKVKGFMASSKYNYDHGEIELLAYYCEIEEGELQALVHDEIQWVRISELLNLDLAPADIPLAKVLLEERNDIVHTGPNI